MKLTIAEGGEKIATRPVAPPHTFLVEIVHGNDFYKGLIASTPAGIYHACSP